MYKSFKMKWDKDARGTNDMVNGFSPNGKEGDAPRPAMAPKSGSPGAYNKDNSKEFNLTQNTADILKSFRERPGASGQYFKDMQKEQNNFPKELEALRQEGIKLGAIAP
jgi:hypothetical protein